jgi:DNA polymerase-3 subunit delta'
VEGKSRHPDIVFLERGLYEPSQIGRKTPETQDISVDQVRTLVLARAAFGPHEGRAKVFIIRRAEELSIAAANALLKTLEEPLPRTHFILLTAQRAELLSTVQSRALPVRFIDRADHAPTEIENEDAALGPALWRVATAKTFSAALDLGASMKKPRDELAQELESAAQWFAARAKHALPDREMSMYYAHVYQWVLDAKHDVLGNAAAQLRLEELVSKMRRELPG